MVNLKEVRNIEEMKGIPEIEELQPRYDSRKSFYKKAFIIKYDNIIFLKSYDTIVAYVENGKYFDYGKFSQTTSRHQKEFRKQFER